MGPEKPDQTTFLLGSASPDSPLTLATSLWMQQGRPFVPDFQKNASERFGASVEQVDFSGNPTEAVNRVNAWCSEKTKGRIPKLFDKFGETTRCVLTGAVHFAADWKFPFDKDSTLDSTFTQKNGEKSKTPMMSQTGKFSYGECDGFVGVEIPYAKDGCSMLVLLPASADEFSKQEAALTSETLGKCRAAMQPAKVNLRIPRFSTETALTLNEPLQSLGIRSAFGRDANFSGISGLNDLYLTEVLQKVYLKIDESGTEAAAATGVVVGVKSADMDVKSFYANRPFWFIIFKQDRILFVGRFLKPETPKQTVDSSLVGEGGEFN